MQSDSNFSEEVRHQWSNPVTAGRHVVHHTPSVDIDGDLHVTAAVRLGSISDSRCGLQPIGQSDVILQLKAPAGKEQPAQPGSG